MIYHVLIQERETGCFDAVMVNGAVDAASALRLTESETVAPIGLRESRQAAVTEAQARNAAAGIVTPGCERC